MPSLSSDRGLRRKKHTANSPPGCGGHARAAHLQYDMRESRSAPRPACMQSFAHVRRVHSLTGLLKPVLLGCNLRRAFVAARVILKGPLLHLTLLRCLCVKTCETHCCRSIAVLKKTHVQAQSSKPQLDESSTNCGVDTRCQAHFEVTELH